SMLILQPIGPDLPDQVVTWVLPSGAAGAVVVAAWLVESKQRVVENMAPVLAMLFTPLFAFMLAVAAVVYLVTGLGGAFDRELVTVLDALLASCCLLRAPRAIMRRSPDAGRRCLAPGHEPA